MTIMPTMTNKCMTKLDAAAKIRVKYKCSVSILKVYAEYLQTMRGKSKTEVLGHILDTADVLHLKYELGDKFYIYFTNHITSIYSKPMAKLYDAVVTDTELKEHEAHFGMDALANDKAIVNSFDPQFRHIFK